jgi:hypothetical protein
MEIGRRVTVGIQLHVGDSSGYGLRFDISIDIAGHDVAAKMTDEEKKRGRRREEEEKTKKRRR